MENGNKRSPICLFITTGKYLMPIGLFFALFFAIAIPPIIIIYIIPVYINSEIKWNPVCSYHESDVAKFQCMPNISQANLTEEECNSWNCCWDDKTHSETIPKCFYSKNYGYIKINSSSAEDNCSISIILSSVDYPDVYGQKYQDIHMHVICIDDATVRIKLTPFNSTEPYEVPLNNILKKDFNDTLYKIIIKDSPFEFEIVRKIDETSIFSTSSNGLIFSDSFWQISSFIPTTNIYGLGQGNHKYFKHQMEWERWTLFNNYPNSTNETTLYGSHPFYLCMEDSGYANGVLLWNSNGMEIALQPAPAITYRTLGGIFDFYFFLGDTPDKVISQLTDIVGKPPMPPYWALGFHLCQRTKNLKEFFEDITRLTHMRIPLESACVDTEYMGLSESSDHATELDHFYRNLSLKQMRVFFRHSPFIFWNAPSSHNAPNDIFVQIAEANETKRYQGECLHKTKRLRCHILDFTNNETLDWMTNFFRVQIVNKGIPLEGLILDDNTPLNYLTSKNTTCKSSDPLNFPKYTLNVTDRFLSYRTLCMDVLHSNEQPHYNIHNLFGHYHLKTAEGVLNKLNHNKRPFLISLSTFSGSGKYGGHWFPDNKPAWSSLSKSLIQILEFGLYGMSLVGSPMCGIRGEADDDVCLRWIQLMSFMPLAINYRTYGESQQDPSTFSKIFISEAREALSTRYRILPYLYTTFYLSHIKGIPVARPLFFEFPKVSRTYDIIHQYMLGSALMVSPTVRPFGNTKEIYLPPQTCWYDFNSGKLITSDFDDLTYLLEESYYVTHLHIRGGYILPSQKPGVTTTASRRNKFVLVVAPGCHKHNNNTANGQILIDDGESIDSFKSDYIFVNITLTNNTLWFHPTINRTDKSTKLRDMITNNNISTQVEAIRILKVHKKPSYVIMNDLNIPFKYSQENKALLLFDMALDLQYDYIIMWTFDDNSTSPTTTTEGPTVILTENPITMDVITTPRSETHNTTTIIIDKPTHIYDTSTINTDITMDAITTLRSENETATTMNVEITSSSNDTLTNGITDEMTTPRINNTSTTSATIDELTTPRNNTSTINETTDEMTTPIINNTSTNEATDEITTPRINHTSTTNEVTDEMTTPKINNTSTNETTDEMTTTKINNTTNEATDEITTLKIYYTSTNEATDEMTTPRINNTSATNEATDEMTTPKISHTSTTDEMTTPKINNTSTTNETTDKMTTPKINNTSINETDEKTTTKINNTTNEATNEMTTLKIYYTSTNEATEEMTTPKINNISTNITIDEMTTPRTNDTFTNAITDEISTSKDDNATTTYIRTTLRINDTSSNISTNFVTTPITNAKTDAITRHESRSTINFKTNEITTPYSNDISSMTSTVEMTSSLTNGLLLSNSIIDIMNTLQNNEILDITTTDEMSEVTSITTNLNNDVTQITNIPTDILTTLKDENGNLKFNDTMDVKASLTDNSASRTENGIKNDYSPDISHNTLNKLFPDTLYNIYRNYKNNELDSESNKPKKNVEMKTSRRDRFSNEFEWT